MYYYLRKKKYDIFDVVWKSLWNIVTTFRWQHHWDITKTKKITFDIRARVWDAVVNKPLIILFSKYLKEELWLDIEILVETSEYNDFVFRDENFGKYYSLQKFQNDDDSHTTLLKYFKTRISTFKLNKCKQRDKSLVYIASSPSHIIKNNWVAVSTNIYLDNYLLDFSLRGSANWYSRHVLLNTIEILVNYFKIPEFWDYINNNLNIFYADYNESNKSWILIFVWNKEFRNLTIQKRYDLILWISKHYKRKKIVIIDDNLNNLYNRLKNYKYQSNVHFVENKFSIDEFKDYAKTFELIIWWDGGGFNYIRTVTNSIWIYTVADPNKWHIFSWRNEYKKWRLFKRYSGYRINLDGKRFGYICKNSRILPSYDYSVGSGYFDDLPVNEFVKFTRSFISDEMKN